jgi:hypothetical protein
MNSVPVSKEHTMFKIGNLQGLFNTLLAQETREGNEALHELGCDLVNLARKTMTEDEIIRALGGRG